MAQQLIASIYGSNQNDWNRTMGVTRGFPTQAITIEALSPSIAYSGVDCNSIITLLPTGLDTNGNKFYSPTDPATLITAANA